MNDLQLALLGAGVGIIALVWIYNLWQERKHKQVAEKIFKGGQPDDVLLRGQAGEERIEPSTPSAAARIEPAMTPLEPEISAAASGAASPLPDAWADDIADCVLHLEFAAPASAPALWAEQSAWAAQLSKTLSWSGYDESAAQWRRLTAHDAGHYAQLTVALQLADRQGAASEAELAMFLDGVQRLAQQFDGLVELPQRAQVLAHAQSLDGFCASVDVQLGVNLVAAAGSAFAGTKLRGLAEAAGFALGADGRFHAGDEDGSEMFTLGNLGGELFEAESLKTLASPGVTFVLDVPRVANGPAVFDRMVAAARQMGQTLGGTLVDGQGHALSDAAIAGIRAKIGEIQQAMTTNQIAPGSARALRLFS